MIPRQAADPPAASKFSVHGRVEGRSAMSWDSPKNTSRRLLPCSRPHVGLTATPISLAASRRENHRAGEHLLDQLDPVLSAGFSRLSIVAVGGRRATRGRRRWVRRF